MKKSRPALKQLERGIYSERSQCFGKEMSFQCMVANANDILVEPHCTPSLPGKRGDINGGPPLVNDDGGVLLNREQIAKRVITISLKRAT